jgi:hypothetical protein
MDDYGGSGSSTTFRDMITLALLGVTIMFLLILPHIAPKVPPNEAMKPVGEVTVEAIWANDTPVDVDLWCKGPEDVQAVGYSAKSGRQFNLLRDDVGTYNDPTGINYEIQASRGIYEGEYIVNLHLYKTDAEFLPVEVTVVITVTVNNVRDRLFLEHVVLKHVGDEETVIRFRLDKDGRLIAGSENHIPIGLRGKQ